MVHLTKQEQMVLCLILGLLLTGWAVKAYRTAHPTTSNLSEGARQSSGETTTH